MLDTMRTRDQRTCVEDDERVKSPRTNPSPTWNSKKMYPMEIASDSWLLC